MICYRDMTFCTADCANDACGLKFTEQVSQDAIVWWGGEAAPIALADRSPFCEDYIPEDSNTMEG